MLLLHHKHYKNIAEVFSTILCEEDYELHAIQILKNKMEVKDNKYCMLSKSFFAAYDKEKKLQDFLTKMRQESSRFDTVTKSDFDVDNTCDQINDDIMDDLLYEDENSISSDDQEITGESFTNKGVVYQSIRLVNTSEYIKAKNFISDLKKEAKDNCEKELLEYTKIIDGIQLASEKNDADILDRIIKLQYLFENMNSFQQEAVVITISHLEKQDCIYTDKNPKGQLRMFLSGEGNI